MKKRVLKSWASEMILFIEICCLSLPFVIIPNVANELQFFITIIFISISALCVLILNKYTK